MSMPHDLAAERSLVGAVMLSTDALRHAASAVNAADFHSPANGEVLDAALALHAQGDTVDVTTVADALRRSGSKVPPATLVAAVAECPGPTGAPKWSAIIAEHSARRRLITAAAELTQAAQTLGDPGELIDTHRAALDRIDLPAGRTDGLMLLDELLDRPDDQRSPWVVPGLLRRDWRAIIVATEGVGKTEVLHQVTMCASQGVHPFTHQEGLPPVTALLVDAENPDERIIDGCTPIRDNLRRLSGRWEPRTWLWHRPGGINLRARRDRASLEAVLSATRPDLVCLGPAYKLAERGQQEGWDAAARAVQTVLDDLRTRHRFAVLMEDHAPQGERGQRDLRPFGSSMWLRWPELGIKLVREDDNYPPKQVNVGHWRGARLRHSWPDRLLSGEGRFSWTGWWANGMERF